MSCNINYKQIFNLIFIFNGNFWRVLRFSTLHKFLDRSLKNFSHIGFFWREGFSKNVPTNSLKLIFYKNNLKPSTDPKICTIQPSVYVNKRDLKLSQDCSGRVNIYVFLSVLSTKT